tara:strand:- start:1853 stop:2023 length:171 start_codon:yes stop_codon:yes gene_type:complete
MNKKEIEQLKNNLEVMTTDELVNIIIEQDQKISLFETDLSKYEEKERNNHKQGKAE